MTENQNDRVDVEDVNVFVEVDYHNEYEGDIDYAPTKELRPGMEPFILFKMKQRDGAIVLDVTASLVENEDELIETLEVFFETMLEERLLRKKAAEMVDETVDEQAREASDV